MLALALTWKDRSLQGHLNLFNKTFYDAFPDIATIAALWIICGMIIAAGQTPQVASALKPIFDEKFPPSSMKVPDQIRAAAFEERFDNWQKTKTTPNLVIMTMTSDHTEGRNPNAPRPRSMVADNDYALGRVVEKISKSKLWAKSLILVVEDDRDDFFLTQDALNSVSGRKYAVAWAGSYDSGATALFEQRFDLQLGSGLAIEEHGEVELADARHVLEMAAQALDDIEQHARMPGAQMLQQRQAELEIGRAHV